MAEDGDEERRGGRGRGRGEARCATEDGNEESPDVPDVAAADGERDWGR